MRLRYFLNSVLAVGLMTTISTPKAGTARFEDAVAEVRQGFGQCAATCTTMIVHNMLGVPIRLHSQYVEHGREDFEVLHRGFLQDGEYAPLVHSKKTGAGFGEGGYIVYDVAQHNLKVIIGFYSEFKDYTTSHINCDIITNDALRSLTDAEVMGLFRRYVLGHYKPRDAHPAESNHPIRIIQERNTDFISPRYDLINITLEINPEYTRKAL